MNTRIAVLGRIGIHQHDRVYDANGISPTINGAGCGGGYNNQPRIVVEDERIYNDNR